MNFQHARFHVGAGTRVEVALSRGGANVMLMTDEALTRYEQGQQFEYHGGNFAGTHATVTAPAAGYWNLVVDLGGAPGTVAANYSLFPLGA